MLAVTSSLQLSKTVLPSVLHVGLHTLPAASVTSVFKGLFSKEKHYYCVVGSVNGILVCLSQCVCAAPHSSSVTTNFYLLTILLFRYGFQYSEEHFGKKGT